MYRRKLSLSSTRLIRTFNAVSVLQTLYKEGSCSRARLTEVTKMSQATIARIVTELTDRGVIVEERVGESNGGRRPIIFRLNYEQLFTVGIQLLKERSSIVIGDIKGKILFKKVFHQTSLEPEKFIKELAREFELLLEGSQIDRENILGVGLAVSGIINRELGLLHKSINLGWYEVKIVELLEKTLGLPVFVENDANAGALAEIWFGGAKNVSSLLYLKAFRGVGVGIVFEGKLLSGVKGMSGEIAHYPLVDNGKPCRCGQHGCIESYLYMPDILQQYARESGINLDDDNELLVYAFDGEPLAEKYIEEISEILAKTITFVTLLLDIDLIIMGELWGKVGKQFAALITQKVEIMTKYSGLNKTILVKPSGLGVDSDLLGAIGLVIDEWFTPPIWC